MKEYELEASNLFYVSNFNVIGGTETYIYELTRKYKDLDITIVYKTGHWEQINRIAKNVKIVKYRGGRIKCKKAFFNYDIDLIDKIDADEYVEVIHAMYKTNKLTPHIHEKINHYFAVSEIAAKEWEELTGIKPIVVRNPLQVLEEEKKPVLILVSATRLTREKGKDRIIKFGKLLNEKGIKYLWLIFTNDTDAIKNPNIVYLKPKLNVRNYLSTLKQCGNVYGFQASDCEGDCYFTRECEALGIPLICTPLPSFEEQGLKDGVNCYYIPFDMQNIDIDRIVNNIPTYKPYIRDDSWRNYLINDKSNYKEDHMKVKLKCIRSYWDIRFQKDMELNEEFIVDKDRSDELLANPNNLVELVEYIEEPKVEKAVIQPKTEKAVKPRKRK